MLSFAVRYFRRSRRLQLGLRVREIGVFLFARLGEIGSRPDGPKKLLAPDFVTLAPARAALGRGASAAPTQAARAAQRYRFGRPVSSWIFAPGQQRFSAFS